jgi:hypothetical protein
MDEVRYCVEILEGSRRKPIASYTLSAFNEDMAEVAGWARFKDVHPTRSLKELSARVTKLPT